MGLWDQITGGFENGEKFLGDSLADWLGLGNDDNDANHPDALDLVLYSFTGLALLFLLVEVFYKFVYI